MCYFLQDFHEFKRLMPHPQNLTQLVCIYPLANTVELVLLLQVPLALPFTSGDELAVVAWVLGFCL